MLSTEKGRRLLALALLPRMKHVSLRGSSMRASNMSRTHVPTSARRIWALR